MDARIVDRERWVDNRQQKKEEKTLKYAQLRMELKRQHPGLEIKQVNIVIDVLGGYSKGLRDNMRSLVVEGRGRHMLRKMQNPVLTSISDHK